ncbi:protein YgfX [Colwelliaceae bacterium 6471]
MPWCNLFSVALKFDIEIKLSRYKYIFYDALIIAFIILCLVIICDEVWQICVYSTLLGIVITSLVFFRYQHDKNFPSQFLTLGIEGKCYFTPDQGWKIQPSSRFSSLGCWLDLKQPNIHGNIDESIKTKQLFIFSDSLSSQDRSRLCRVISRLKSNNPNV